MDWQYYKNSLAKARIKSEKGLSDFEIEQIEATHKFQFPPDLKEFLQFGLHIGKKWIDWRNDSEDKIKAHFDCVYDGFNFDIEHNSFWLKEWGKKPKNLTDAFESARLKIEKAPKLIPIYSHRYIPEKPHQSGNPIFSVYQTDIIIYERICKVI